MNIKTNSNIISTLTLKTTGLNTELNRWEILYSITETSLFGAAILNTKTKTVVIKNTPEQPILDEDGNVIDTIPATTDLTEFFAAFDGEQSLIDLSLERATHNGTCYESTAPNNVWEPGVYGWTVIPCI